MTSYLICIKMTSPSLKKLVTKFFCFSILQTIDSSKETKLIMKLPRKWHKAPEHAACRGTRYSRIFQYSRRIRVPIMGFPDHDTAFFTQCLIVRLLDVKKFNGYCNICLPNRWSLTYAAFFPLLDFAFFRHYFFAQEWGKRVHYLLLFVIREK